MQYFDSVDAAMTAHRFNDEMSARTRCQSYAASLQVCCTFRVLAAILALAAAAKSHELATTPVTTSALLVGLALIGAEFAIAARLVLGPPTSVIWTVSLITFCVFACASGYKVLSGQSSCGCFGTIEVSPWVTLNIDGFAILALLACWRKLAVAKKREATRSSVYVAAVPFAIVAVLALVRQMTVTDLERAGIVSGELVRLEPETWVGRPLRLLSHVNIDEDLSTGVWTLLLFRYDCHLCHKVMEELLVELSRSGEFRIALIGIDPHQDDNRVSLLHASGCAVGHLRTESEWFVTTPLRVTVEQGVCVEVTALESWALFHQE